MRRLFMPVVLLLAAPLVAAETTRLPLTVAERISACAEVEDSDPARAVALADSVLDEPISASPLQRADALGCRGWAMTRVDRRDDAKRDAHALHAIAAALSTGAERVRLLRRSGGILHRAGDRVGAVDFYSQALKDAEAQGLEAERIPLLVNLGVMQSEFEEHERARVNYEQALALMQRTGDFRYEAPVQFNLALNLRGQERDAEAIPHLRRALELMQQSGMGGPRQLVSAKLALAESLLVTGSVDASTQLVAEVRAGDASAFDDDVLMQLAMLEAARLAESGDAQAALEALDRIDTARLTDIPLWGLLKRRADLLERLGRHAEAVATLRRITALREATLRSQNHERLAALDSHLRDREQRAELERLHAAGAEQDRQMLANQRLQWAGLSIAALLLLIGSAMLIWQRRMNRRLYMASQTDPLTGLANRRAAAERLRALSSESTSTALLLIDIDHFKQVNDDLGHDIGDEVLICVARRLRERAGEGSLVARWGGEEFLVVVPHSSAEAAAALAELLRREFARPIDTHNGSVVAHASIGIANLPLPGAGARPEHWHASLQLADAALYLAKRSGRDAWACYWIEHAISDWPVERLGRESSLARSLGVITPTSSRPLREPVATVPRQAMPGA